MTIKFMKYLKDKKQKKYLKTFMDFQRNEMRRFRETMSSEIRLIILKGRVDEIDLSKYQKEKSKWIEEKEENKKE